MPIRLTRGCCDAGASGIGETEDFGDFIESFADGIVQSGADNFEIIVRFHVDELGVTAGDDESYKRETWKGVILAQILRVRFCKFLIFRIAKRWQAVWPSL